MNPSTLPDFRSGFAVPARDADQLPGHVRRMRVGLLDGASTTLYIATYPLARTEVRVVRLAKPQRLQAWCELNGVAEAMVGGFYARPHGTPLGELRTSGVLRRHVPFDDPWGDTRACLHVEGGQVRIARRHELPQAPAGDLLQAGPLLVRDGLAVDGDPEGFSAGQRQFDSDITAGRYPRAALGIAPGKLLAVVCDGRADHDSGLSMAEFAETLVALGAHSAINLDGGGSASLVAEGQLWNRPREEHGIELSGGRAVTTALVFRPAA
jgi:hypothetical protein